MTQRIVKKPARKSKYEDYPIEDCAKALERVLAQHPGTVFHQKWTCARCGERVTAGEPNKLFTSARHEDCGHVTDITKTGCNYLLMMPAA
jgi:hypothetical protein